MTDSQAIRCLSPRLTDGEDQALAGGAVEGRSPRSGAESRTADASRQAATPAPAAGEGSHTDRTRRGSVIAHGDFATVREDLEVLADALAGARR